MKSIGCALLLSLMLFGCTTSRKKEVVPGFPSAPPPASEADSSFIDYPALQRSLHMDRERENLGFNEKTFNTCNAGYGYSSSKNCHTENFVVVNFRLMCRDTDGTISTILTDQDLKSLDRRSVRWSLKGLQGTVQTDSDGYGQIVTTSIPSQKNQRIRLSIGAEFLFMRATDIQRVITPNTWCDLH